MIVGTLKLKLLIREARSLKDKRRVLNSLRDRIRHEFNVSVAEVGDADLHQYAVLGVAVVGSDRRLLEQILSQVVDLVRRHPVAQLADYEVET
jgi:hypothetical protein